jgi:hypothetical protein
MEVSGKRYAVAILSPGKNSDTHWIGGWLGPTADLEEFGETKSFAPAGIKTPDRPAIK